MNDATRFLSVTALACALSNIGVAQSTMAQSPPPANPRAPTAQSEAGDPRADTSNPGAGEPGAGAPASGASEAASRPAGVAVHGRRSAKGAAQRDAPASDATAAGSPAAGTPAAGSPAASKAPGKADRLDLGTATVTGDREQPKVMYIVPWKGSDIGDLAGKPMNSLVDEILAPVDRDVFKREVIYYRAVQADASQNAATPKPAPQGEK